MHYGWRPLLLIQILPLSQSKPLFSCTKEENEEGGSCVTQAQLNFIDTQMCICNPRQSCKTGPGGVLLGHEGGVCQEHTWGLQGSYPGLQDVRALAVLGSGCFVSPLAAYLRCCTMCAFAAFSRLFLFTFFPPPQLFSRIPASFGLLCHTLLVFSGREQLEEELGCLTWVKGGSEGPYLSLKPPERRL